MERVYENQLRLESSAPFWLVCVKITFTWGILGAVATCPVSLSQPSVLLEDDSSVGT